MSADVLSLNVTQFHVLFCDLKFISLPHNIRDSSEVTRVSHIKASHWDVRRSRKLDIFVEEQTVFRHNWNTAGTSSKIRREATWALTLDWNDGMSSGVGGWWQIPLFIAMFIKLLCRCGRLLFRNRWVMASINFDFFVCGKNSNELAEEVTKWLLEYLILGVGQ